MTTRIGQQLGNYRLLRLLGRGGFAEVFLGEQVYLTTHAALKVLHVRLTDEQVLDFLQEARTIAHLEHPHIVQVLDYGVQEGTPFLVMRYAPHGSLRTAHPKSTRLPLETIVPYVKQVVAALEYAHERKLIHRDIKPENMLLGTHHEVFLADFGLAVMAQSSQQQELQHVVGTLWYMAPEQLRGISCLGSDQYALGVVVYEWLCGALPFVGSSLEVAMQHLTTSPPPLREKVPTLSPAVEQVVLKALAKDPVQRYESITAFATALEQAVLSEGVHHTTHPIPEQHSPPLCLPYLGRQHQGPLVGRTQEWERLRQLLLEIEASTSIPHIDHRPATLPWSTPSHPSCMMVLGEAGIGKTRLAEEFSREAQRRGWAVIWSRGYAQESGIAYRLWIEIVRNAIVHRLWQPQEEKRSSLLSQSLPALMALVPELADLLSQDRATSSIAPGQEQLRLWEGILALLSTMSERMPLLIVLDDLHWADSSSCELLSYLARRLVGQRLLLLGTCRERDLPSTNPLRVLFATLQREQVLSMLHLSPLTDDEISMLVAHVPTPLIGRIQRYASGNPLFAEELARACSAEEMTSSDVASLLQHTDVAVPQTISAILDLRLSTLSSACQYLLSRATLLGGSFEFDTIRLMEVGGSDTGEDTILTLLEEALQSGMLTEEGSGTRITYHFWHPLLVSHLYSGLSAGRRASLHRCAAEALRQTYQGREEDGAATIVYHLLHGGADSPQIVSYAELAGDRASRLCAYAEAERYYRVAVEREDADRIRVQEPGVMTHSGSSDRQFHLASLLERLAECTMILGNYEETRRLYEWLLQLHNSSKFTATSSDAMKQEAQFQAMVWCEIGWTWWYEGEPAKVRQCHEHSEQVLRDAAVVAGPVWAHLLYQQGSISWQEGDYTAARLSAQKALRLFEEVLSPQHPRESLSSSTRIQRTLAGDPVDLGRIHKLLALIAVIVGQMTDATVHLNEAMVVFEQYDRQREIAMVCGNLGDIHLRKAEYALAQAAFHRALGIAERIGDTPSMSACLGNLGLVAARLGDLPKAEDLLRRGFTLAKHVGDPVYSIYFQSYLALMLQERGKMVEAADCILGALTTSRSKHIPPCMGLALVTLGLMRIAQVDTDTVGHCSRAEPVEPDHKDIPMRSLWRAEASIRHALTIEGLEAEAKIEGQLALAQIFLMRSELEKAHQQAIHALQEAQQYESMWLLPGIRRLFGSILAAQNNYEQADQQFEQVLLEYRACGMRLQYARTLQRYAVTLLQRSTPEETNYHKGRSYLYEAREYFLECQAALDLQRAERILVAYNEASTQKILTGTGS